MSRNKLHPEWGFLFHEWSRFRRTSPRQSKGNSCGKEEFTYTTWRHAEADRLEGHSAGIWLQTLCLPFLCCFLSERPRESPRRAKEGEGALYTCFWFSFSFQAQQSIDNFPYIQHLSHLGGVCGDRAGRGWMRELTAWTQQLGSTVPPTRIILFWSQKMVRAGRDLRYDHAPSAATLSGRTHTGPKALGTLMPFPQYFCAFFSTLGTEPRASHTLGKHSTIELNPMFCQKSFKLDHSLEGHSK